MGKHLSVYTVQSGRCFGLADVTFTSTHTLALSKKTSITMGDVQLRVTYGLHIHRSIHRGTHALAPQHRSIHALAHQSTHALELGLHNGRSILKASHAHMHVNCNGVSVKIFFIF